MTASEIANKCIESLESDNGGEFFASSHQMSNLVAGIQLMIDAGCPFGDDDPECIIEVLCCGEDSEQKAIIAAYNGQMADSALNSIFDHEEEE